MAVKVVYESVEEVLVCNLDEEPELLKNYFGLATGRCKDDYDRILVEGAVTISSRVETQIDREIA